ncbi:MAG: SEC-C domain-containing protein, partial [Elusimicrobia bacterium]|nr:SEC-C domain-containing protein [Elusimicrobiota bacterium]
DDIQGEWVHHVTQALRAHTLYKRDVDYVVKDGQVIIVDEFTGRLMPGRRWSEGLHQAVEAKEGLRIAEENQTLATITFQNFFRLYEKLAGMTGTALTEAAEFWEIYKLDVVEIPTNKPMIRVDYADVIYRTEREKDDAITGEIEELWKQGQPVLLGTRSIEKSEKLAALLRRKGIPHQVLNAKYHEREAQIIAQAGRKGTCTIATNMAGRGTDIVLSGSPPDPTEAEFIKQLGGLHVLGTERHESRRIDNQLRGRCGRQGDPGSSRFYLSLEDELMRLFGSDRLSGLMQRLGMKEGEDIQHPWVTKAIENAQRKVEAMNFDIRKQLLEYDNVMNKQREVVYALRNEILDGEAVNQQIKDMILESIEEKVATIAADKRHPEEWDVAGVLVWMRRTFDVSLQFTTEEIVDLTPERLQERLRETAEQAYQERERKMGSEEFRHLERMILLQMIDIAWKEHLYDLDQLKKGIGLRAYGQKDPLVEYQHESFNLFTTMMRRIREQTVEYLFRIHMEPFTPRPVFVPTRAEKPEVSTAGLVAQGVMADARSGRSAVMEPMGAPSTGGPVPGGGKPTPVTVPKKIGRNDPCPCGSGKKYKKCCGR